MSVHFKVNTLCFQFALHIYKVSYRLVSSSRVFADKTTSILHASYGQVQQSATDQSNHREVFLFVIDFTYLQPAASSK